MNIAHHTDMGSTKLFQGILCSIFVVYICSGQTPQCEKPDSCEKPPSSCHEDLCYPNPANCSTYYWCVNSVMQLRSCGATFVCPVSQGNGYNCTYICGDSYDSYCAAYDQLNCGSGSGNGDGNGNGNGDGTGNQNEGNGNGDGGSTETWVIILVVILLIILIIVIILFIWWCCKMYKEKNSNKVHPNNNEIEADPHDHELVLVLDDGGQCSQTDDDASTIASRDDDRRSEKGAIDPDLPYFQGLPPSRHYPPRPPSPSYGQTLHPQLPPILISQPNSRRGSDNAQAAEGINNYLQQILNAATLLNNGPVNDYLEQPPEYSESPVPPSPVPSVYSRRGMGDTDMVYGESSGIQDRMENSQHNEKLTVVEN